MKQKKKPQINSVGWQHRGVDNNKTNKIKKPRPVASASHGGGGGSFKLSLTQKKTKEHLHISYNYSINGNLKNIHISNINTIQPTSFKLM